MAILSPNKRLSTYEKCFLHPLVDYKFEIIHPNFKVHNVFRWSLSIKKLPMMTGTYIFTFKLEPLNKVNKISCLDYSIIKVRGFTYFMSEKNIHVAYFGVAIMNNLFGCSPTCFDTFSSMFFSASIQIMYGAFSCRSVFTSIIGKIWINWAVSIHHIFWRISCDVFRFKSLKNGERNLMSELCVVTGK